MKARKGCWTCKARRVPCDGGLPTCQTCAQARRGCQGYETRLSWPRDGDKRRATTGGPPPLTVSPGHEGNFYFVNTTWRDMELYHQLARHMQPLDLVRPSPNPRSQHQVGGNDMDLVNYFHHSAHHSLVMFDMKTLPIRDALIRMALTDDSGPGLALLYALLAFSSLHRSGLNQQAVQLKIAALHSLSASAKEEPLTSAEAAQHLAASMLLGAFDILLPSESSGEWLWYTQGAVDIVHSTCLQTQSNESDIGHLLGWVYFHDALSRFPMQHWQHKSLAREAHATSHNNPRSVQYPPLTRYRPAVPCPKPSFAILSLLSEVCNTLLDPRDPRSHSEEYHDHLGTLDRRIGSVSTKSASATWSTDAELAVEVFQTATRVYLARASQSPWETPKDLDALIDKAFAGPIQDCSCPHSFPLFILACEARGDDQRTAILNLIDRAERNGYVRSKTWLRGKIQSIWVHQDLHADSDLLVNYGSVVGAVINSSDTVPSFV